MALKRAAVFAALFLFGLCRAVLAQDVTLTSRDGAVEITGTLLGFDGTFYRVDTVYGELTVDGSGVRCEGPGCPNLIDFVAELTFSGSSTMAEVLMPALVTGFAQRRGLDVTRALIEGGGFMMTLSDPDDSRDIARLRFRVSTTDEGFADLLANETDVVLALREMRPLEIRRAREAGMGDMTANNRARVLALDAMVPVVAPGNPVHSISTPDLARVYAGLIDNWSVLGGPNAPIALHLSYIGSGQAQAVEDRLLRPAELLMTRNITRHRRSADVARAVIADPFALGIASFAEIGGAVPLTLTGTCGFSLSATRRTIKTEDYPLTSPMFLYLPARRLPQLGREFLRYLRGPAAQIVIRRAGFVDQAPEEIAIDLQGDRFANAIRAAGQEVAIQDLQRMVRTLAPMRRLTTSFRFEPGSSRLDAQSRSNVEQLAESLETGTYDTRRLLFAGFSDGQGAADTNRDLAMRRARAVRAAVLTAAETLDADQVTLEVEAFGEAMPMACDDSAWGRQVNRRVEVWID